MRTIPVSWTQINTARECPHKHWLRYDQGWRWPKVARPLALGILWHELLDAHYRPTIGRAGPPGIEAARDLLVEAGVTNRNSDGFDIASTCLWMYDGYRKFWGDDLDWKVLDVEIEVEAPLGEVELPPGRSTPAETVQFMLYCRLDLLIEVNGHLWVIDHKANKNLPSNKELDLDDQMPLYIWAMRQQGYPVRGAQFNIARTYQTKQPQTLDGRFQRLWAYRSDDELETVRREAIETLVERYRPDATHGRHPDPMNCKWRCPYVEACIGGRKSPHLEEQILVAEGFTKRDREST
jgi:hypothetical protein